MPKMDYSQNDERERLSAMEMNPIIKQEYSVTTPSYQKYAQKPIIINKNSIKNNRIHQKASQKLLNLAPNAENTRIMMRYRS